MTRVGATKAAIVLIAFVLAMAACGDDDSAPNEPDPPAGEESTTSDDDGDGDDGGDDDDDDDELTAFDSCTDFVRHNLEVPDSAEFPDFSDDIEVTSSDNVYTVESFVDADDSTGETARFDYVCEMRVEDGATVLVSLHIDEP